MAEEPDVPLAWLHALERTNHALEKALAHALGETGLPYLDAHAILVIAEHGTVPLGEVRSGLGRGGSTMTAVIDRLERRGLVRRRTASDRRALELEVTDEGAAAATVVRGRLAAVEATIRERLGPRRYREAIAMLVDTAELASPSETPRAPLERPRPG
jgi:DNA-binding MarR family transcriptional regulator